MTRTLDQIVKDEGIRFSPKSVRSNKMTIKVSDEWVIHQRVVGAYAHMVLAPLDRWLLALPFIAISATVICVLLGWDIAMPLGIVASIFGSFLAVRSFERLVDVKRHEHAMKTPVYALDIQRGSQYCEFFESKDAEEVRILREALEDFLTKTTFASTGARRTA